MRKEKGMALAISLIFLVLVTLIAVSTMRQTIMNETIASNFELDRMAYQAAESALAVITTGEQALAHTPADPKDYSASAVDMTQDNVPITNMASSAKAVIWTGASIQYCGEDARTVGQQVNLDDAQPPLVAHIYAFRGTADISEAKVYSEHEQKGYLIRPSAGRGGACP